MRVTGGQARGIPLYLPKGDTVRPATDAMRQAVFSSIASRVPEARFLDLFAGSGAYGLEALSRGASGGTFVEKDARVAEYLRSNLASVCKSLGRGPEDLTVIQADAIGVPLPAGVAPPDLVFIDPPYATIPEVAPALFARLAAVLEPVVDPVIIFELPGELVLEPAGWTCVKRLGKGDRQPTVCFFRANRALT